MSNNYKVFDLPTIHLSGRDYIPPRTRNRDEAERRRSLRPGTLILEKQAEGLRNAGALLSMLDRDDTDSLVYASGLIAVGALNASWYTFGRDAAPMRRVLRLPEMVDEDGYRLTQPGLVDLAKQGLADAAIMATQLAEQHASRELSQRSLIRFGRQVGNVGVKLACIPLANYAWLQSPEASKALLRDEALHALEDARTMADDIGTNPSLAQLADRDSGMMVELRRSAPDGLFEAAERLAA